MSDILIKNATLVNYDSIQNADILVSEGKIKKIGHIKSARAKVLDASNLFALPGGIDVHTHMELPISNGFSSDSFSTGTRAALYGGTTTIIDFANQTKGKSVLQAFDYWQSRAWGNTFTDYSLHASITDVTPETLNDMDHLFNIEGVSSFKTFLAYPHNRISLNDLQIVMKKTRELGGIVMLHAECNDILNTALKQLKNNNQTTPNYHPLAHPEYAEEKAVAESIELAIKENCPLYIVHLSSKKALQHIIEAKKSGHQIYAETCPQYLIHTEEKYHHHDPLEIAKYIMSPPLRKKRDLDALWEAIFSGYIDVIATDHCPFTTLQKRKSIEAFWNIPNGLPGVENRMELFFFEACVKRGLSSSDFVRLVSYNPAKIFGLTQKGHLEAGLDADIILFDPNMEHILSIQNHHMNVDYSAYEGMNITGKCATIIKKGVIVIQDDFIINDNFKGNYTKRARPDLSSLGFEGTL